MSAYFDACLLLSNERERSLKNSQTFLLYGDKMLDDGFLFPAKYFIFEILIIYHCNLAFPHFQYDREF